jgi:hypothetical protein
MPEVLSDWHIGSERTHAGHGDAPVRGERLHRTGADRAVPMEWAGPKPVPLFGPAIETARSPDQGFTRPR